jgi:CBS domain-containing protein
MISRRDLLKAAGRHQNDNTTWEWMRAHPENLSLILVKHIMNPEVHTVAPEMGLSQTAELMMHYHYTSIPVASNNVVLGIIRLRDVLRYMEAAEEMEPADRGE